MGVVHYMCQCCGFRWHIPSRGAVTAERLVQSCPIPKFRSVPPPNATPVLFATGGCGLERSSAAVSSFSDPSVPCDAACSQYLPREHWHYASSSSQHGRVSGCDQECMNSSGLFSRGGNTSPCNRSISAYCGSATCGGFLTQQPELKSIGDHVEPHSCVAVRFVHEPYAVLV
jgi:hypothetical protein